MIINVTRRKIAGRRDLNDDEEEEVQEKAESEDSMHSHQTS